MPLGTYRYIEKEIQILCLFISDTKSCSYSLIASSCQLFSLQNLRKLTTGAKYRLGIYLSMTAIMSVREAVVSRGNFTPGQSWGALRKAWKGYRIAKVQGDNAKMSEYATKIRKLQGELGISVASFPHLGIN
jgi:hypothetical protein